jgi:hypothetical protein
MTPLSSLCLNNVDVELLDRYAQNPRGSILLVAEKGFGKTTLAMTLSTMITGSHEGEYVHSVLTSDSGSISIEAIKNVREFFKLKTLVASQKRIVVIETVESMTHEAQNALLKILEEPPINCFFILVSHDSSQVLPTIVSRVQRIMIRRPTEEQLATYFSKNFAAQDVTSAISLSGRLPASVHSILSKESNFVADAIHSSKLFLGLTPYERLVGLNDFARDKVQFEQLLSGLEKVIHAMISVHVLKGQSTQLAGWKARLKKLNAVKEKVDTVSIKTLYSTLSFLK